MPRNEVEAAYFTLLRAREELQELRRYEEYLRDERGRLRRFRSEGAALSERVAARHRRALAHTDRPVEDALRVRLAVVDEELARLPDRLAAAEAFVTECEDDHARLRRPT